ncbi:MAG: bifunctional protein-serine/threonine kinase/phosphatase [Burkholderiales bacterium]|nr:bifunctional protein-serine/threonine kinase/phosphatase [Burkholderiales bacterium]
MAFEIDIGFTSLAGTKEVNEDFAAAMLPEPGHEALGAIAAIADGVSMGGMGREAAQTTVTSVVRDYFGTPETWDATVALDRIIGAQNSWLAGVNRRRQPACGLTTLTALVLRGQGYSLAHVGDTRAYLMREGEVTQLTHDHAMDHPDMSHKLLRAVGAEDRLVVDYSQGEMHVGDVFVLVSDGVHGVLPARHFKTLPTDTAQALSESLVQAALQKGSNDNATALVVRVLGVEEAGLHDENRAAQQLPVPPKLKVGDVIDGYSVTARVADNGINVLYQVRDTATRKLHALKTLHPSRAHDAEERAMLAHESWLAKRMRTSRAAENLVAVNDVPSPTAFYLLYDWHGGETLQQVLDRKQPPAVLQAVNAVTQVARALGRLHRQGVIHRDVKPANLHQGEDGVLRLLDLGVALTGREPEAARLLHAGTPSYINPEQWGWRAQGGEAPPEAPDAQSDLFALGVTLYQLLTGGKLPYGDVLPYQAGRYWRDPIAPSRHNPEVPIWLDHIALKAVARDKRQRFETAEEMLLALERGASRPLTAPAASPLIHRDPAALWKIAVGVSVLFNVLLVYWLLFLPK